MRSLLSLSFVMLYLNYAISQYDYNIVSEDEDEYQLYYHEESVLKNGGTAYSVNVKETINECAHHCALANHICKSVYVEITNNNKYKCFFYKKLGDIHSGGAKSSVISTTPDVKPYCSSLDYLNICGKCKCIDVPATNKAPYGCDCTDYANVTKDCQDAFDSGYTQSGIYKVNPDNGKPFKVYCIMNANDKGVITFLIMTSFRLALTTILRRASKDRSYLSLNDTYYYENDDSAEIDHMIGVEYIQRLTNFTSMDLLMKLNIGTYFASRFIVKGKEENYKYDFLQCNLHNGYSYFGQYKDRGNFQKCTQGYWWYCQRNPTSAAQIAKLTTSKHETYCEMYLHRTNV